MQYRCQFQLLKVQSNDLTRAGVSAFNGVLVGTVISVLYPPQYGVDRDLKMWMFIVVGSFLRYTECVNTSVSRFGQKQDILNYISYQGYYRYKYFGYPNQIQDQIRLVLFVLTDTKIRYHYGKMANFVSHVTICRNLIVIVIVDHTTASVQPCKKKTARGTSTKTFTKT